MWQQLRRCRAGPAKEGRHRSDDAGSEYGLVQHRAPPPSIRGVATVRGWRWARQSGRMVSEVLDRVPLGCRGHARSPSIMAPSFTHAPSKTGPIVVGCHSIAFGRGNQWSAKSRTTRPRPGRGGQGFSLSLFPSPDLFLANRKACPPRINIPSPFHLTPYKVGKGGHSLRVPAHPRN